MAFKKINVGQRIETGEYVKLSASAVENGRTICTVQVSKDLANKISLKGDFISVFVGEGEDHGKFAIQPAKPEMDGVQKITRSGSGVCKFGTQRLPTAHQKLSTVECEFRVDPLNMLVITLPEPLQLPAEGKKRK